MVAVAMRRSAAALSLVAMVQRGCGDGAQEDPATDAAENDQGLHGIPFPKIATRFWELIYI